MNSKIISWGMTWIYMFKICLRDFLRQCSFKLNIDKSFCWNSDIRPFPFNFTIVVSLSNKRPKVTRSEHDYKK